MRIGPILERELLTLVRRKTAFLDRYVAIVLELAVVLGCAWVWDHREWDRRSLAGVSAFALTLFVLTLGVLLNATFGLVIAQVSKAIASERDRKSLDALLATQLSSAEIVLGTLAAGLVRWANGLATLVPVLVLLIPFGGVDPRLILLGGVGLASTAFALAAISVVASIVARTARGAIAMAISLTTSWFALPLFVLIMKPRLWPSGPAWIVTIAIELLASSPFGLVANLSGIVRRGSPIQAVWRMVGWELIGGLLLVAWAIWQLRLRSRAHYDNETRVAGRRILRAARWRLPRPPCGDDPVLWHTVYSNRTASPFARILGHLINLGWLGVLGVVMGWFAVAAFKELATRGYGATPEAFTMPDANPLARVLYELLSGTSGGPSSGQARLEFNLALRTFSAFFAVFYVCSLSVGAMQSMEAERERDTWTGLIATPLSGWEIVWAKMWGALIRSRPAVILMVGLWTVGVLAGSVHPLGFIAALVGMAVTGVFVAGLGVYAGLMAVNGRDAKNLIGTLPYLLCLSGLAILLPGRGSVLAAAASPPLLALCSLFIYEDIHTVFNGGLFPLGNGPSSYKPGLEARLVLALWGIGTLAQAVGALAVMRAMSNGFDAAVGRPTRPRSLTEKPSRHGMELPLRGIDGQVH
ncbi:hypothetical protein SAMN05444166_1346 [Singulisphaera sp. GP187]|uniref:ABC transporter permease subunit n=1 Tax=Singulisphaera sp. GP187 TaxID=1882752 RepID=UPI000927DA24|nr:ABC transporter permease subunit [Singulisphaera sp. GP187]SIN86661.1 hypothetical protein SAMN05444166_1346 [Singulisphaera sp. GP187]